MTTWTEVTQQSETWTGEAPSLHTYSPAVFSHAFSGALRVFSLRSADGTAEVWDERTRQAETWTASE